MAAKLPTYTAPTYDDSKYKKGIDTSYYTNAINTYKTQAEKQRTTQLNEAKKTQDAALKQAYITRAQNQQKLNESLATAGIRGGATETSNLRLQNAYGTAVGAANSDYNAAATSILPRWVSPPGEAPPSTWTKVGRQPLLYYLCQMPTVSASVNTGQKCCCG